MLMLLILVLVVVIKNREEIVMKKVLWLLGGLTAITFTSCTSEDILQDNEQNTLEEKVCVTAYAPEENSDSRVTLTPAIDAHIRNVVKVKWEDEESFSVIRNGENKTFSKTTAGNTFTGVLPDAEGAGAYYAVYPVNSEATDATAVPYDLSKQTGVLDEGKTFMTATSESSSFQFKHQTAILSIDFTGLPEGTKIKYVSVETEAKTQGSINLTTGEMTGDSKGIFIDCDENVASKVFIYLPPMGEDDNKTLHLIVAADNNLAYSGSLSRRDNSYAISAGYYYTASVALTEMNSLVFFADGEQTLLISKEVSTLQYSTDRGANWTDLSTNTISFGNGKALLLRAQTMKGTAGVTNLPPYPQFVFGNDNVVACAGDIRTLEDYTNYKNLSSHYFSYQDLFYECVPLISAPALPAETISSSCYRGMFRGCKSLRCAPALPAKVVEMSSYRDMFYDCTSLETAPALPAHTVKYDGYDWMFRGCTSLKTAPELPATTLEGHCYSGMFQECSSLEDAPALPATTVSADCYANMFNKCTSLKTAPELPATTLAPYCYYYMFYGCTSLTSTPILAATTLVERCYYKMFSNCSKLNNVTMLATDVSAEYCTYFWLEDVAATGTFIKAESATLTQGYNCVIPSNWTVIN